MDHLESYQALYQRACERKGGPARLEAMLGEPLSPEALAQLGDDRILAEFTRKVFQSGFVWRVVDDKWSGFEAVFFDFDIEKVLLMSDEMLEKKAQDPRIIRNFNKVKTVRDNALMMADVARQHGSFARFLADWPASDIIGLWAYLKKHGSRLGGNTGAYALRMLGKDTFIISQDVEAYFRARNVVSGGINSKRNHQAIQQAFNQLQQQSGRSMQALSRIIAFSQGDNFMQPEAVESPASQVN
ncbi:DNA-3-methyladenine glycosylase I [Aestuariibacter halophilus]|uniref:DNA-3-methyladenine glycosylase I n=1 Tax=Fluctibacter halophilus TaxID=226011 RepID=A0ABS8G9H5_9ALTE|nr:DNA-3-methyladenine glycosylase I [Aestuariibacter halophilus]MCC2617195.1 DNA-3-methyladenine glycosylase I [Aestuariibacter halophilus]